MQLVEKIFTLQNTLPFDTLRHSELILTANIAKVKKYVKGSILIDKDALVQNLFIIRSGEAIYKEKRTSNLFGAEELLNDVTLNENVVANTDIEALVISKGHFYTLIYECPEFMIELIKHFNNNRIEK